MNSSAVGRLRPVSMLRALRRRAPWELACSRLSPLRTRLSSTATSAGTSVEEPPVKTAASAATPAVKDESFMALVKRIVAKKPKTDNKDGKDAVPDKVDGVSLRRLVTLLRPEAVPVGVSVATLAVTTGISLLFPYAIGQILDVALATDAAWSPGTISLGLLGLFGIQSGLIVLRSSLLTVSGERMAAALRKDAFRAMLSQDVAWFDSRRTGELINTLSSDTALVQKALTNNVANGLRSVAMTLGGTGMLFYLSPSLAMLSLGLIPPVSVIGMYYGRYLQGQQRAVQEALGEATSAAEEILSQIRTVRSFAAERPESRRFSERVNASYAQARRIGIVAGLFDGAVHMAANVSLVAVLWYGGSLVSTHAMSAGELTAFLLYSVYTGFNVSSISSTYTELKRASGGASRIFEITDRVPPLPLSTGSGAEFWGPEMAADAVAEDPAGQPWFLRRSTSSTSSGGAHGGYLAPRPEGSQPLTTLPVVRGEVTFSDVTFAYPSRPDQHILSGMTLTVPAGKTIAVVGASGSGKSTLAALLTRLYDPASGSVALDGVPLTQLDPSWLRGSVVGSVAQEPQLFASTIADNIRYGRRDATDEEVVAAAKMANAHAFVSRFPDGYATYVGERGLKLSGGEKQRVAIARAILKNPPILILDEATSALDAESESAVMGALDAVSAGRTVITIAHRLSTMQRADLVAVIGGGGRVVEVGTFRNLFADPSSAFRQLIEKQLGMGAGLAGAPAVAPVVGAIETSSSAGTATASAAVLEREAANAAASA